ncbi:hypothetical protein [Martelella mediterranea]|uniref:hypothetical protein n=1 Tax=Martelella mediterranea TaxID=293089 RepID=UPI000370B40A|nr:hypothetical protein [Martelella mediterranea]
MGESQKGYARQAVRWVDGEIESLGGLDGAESALSAALGFSGNGAVAVGTLYSSNNGFRWTEDGGMLTVEDWLTASGADMPQNAITETADATNEDGSVVVGVTKDDEVYIARGEGTGPTNGGGGTGGTGGGNTGGGTGGNTGGGTGGNTGGGGTGGNTGGGGSAGSGGTGGGSTAGGGAGGVGLITVTSLATSIGTTATVATAALNSLGIIVNGAGSRPLDRRAPAGKSIT